MTLFLKKTKNAIFSLFILFHASNAFSDPQSLINECANLNNYGINQAQNYLGKTVGCWISTSVSGPGLIFPTTSQTASPVQAYWILDKSGNEYSCVSLSHKAWTNYSGLNINNLFDNKGELNTQNFSYDANNDAITVTDSNFNPNMLVSSSTLIIHFKRMDTNNDGDKSILGKMIFPDQDPYYTQIVNEVNGIGSLEIENSDYHNTFTACTNYPSN